MISKAQIKHIRSLQQKKVRQSLALYVVEGDKLCREWLAAGAEIAQAIATESWLREHLDVRLPDGLQWQVTSPEDLAAMSSLETQSGVLLVVKQPLSERPQPMADWSLGLDAIRDPGNFGTILRIADWFGIRQVFASNDCVDAFNPKVVQAGMGAHLRVSMIPVDLPEMLSRFQSPVYAAALDGENVFAAGGKRYAPGMLLIGNESAGLSESLKKQATHAIAIPRLGRAESLNAAVATGILCSALMLPLLAGAVHHSG